MNKTDVIEVKTATYIDGYRLRIAFSNGKEKIVDFSDFISANNKEALSKYKNSSHFKKFKVEQGNIVWGKTWDMVFPVHELYRGRIS